jgi:hypothetical protein
MKWLRRIYSVSYEIVRWDRHWWCYKCEDWTTDIKKSQHNGCDQGFSSHAYFKSKKDGLNAFDKLTLDGIDCCFCVFVIKFGKRYVTEYESKEQDYFNENNKGVNDD